MRVSTNWVHENKANKREALKALNRAKQNRRNAKPVIVRRERNTIYLKHLKEQSDE